MEEGSVLVGMVRHPLTQFISFFNYYMMTDAMQKYFPIQAKGVKQIDFFLNNSQSLLHGKWKKMWSSAVRINFYKNIKKSKN